MNNCYDPNQQWQGFGGNGNYLNTNTAIPNTFRQQMPQPQPQQQAMLTPTPVAMAVGSD